MDSHWTMLPVAALLAAPAAVYATNYLTVPQAQALMFPGETLTPRFITLSDSRAAAIEKASHARVLTPEVHAWRASGGGWFFADQVYGKHELIAYAVGLDAGGNIKDVEILSYREAYGGEVRLPAWRKQFTDKHAGDKLELNDDIKNIAGATISCRHVTEGVRRLVTTWALVLRQTDG